MSEAKADDYPPQIWLASATRGYVREGCDIRQATAMAVAHWQEQGRLAKLAGQQ
jgi:hypothetical protein